MKFSVADKMCYNKRRFPSDIAASGGIGRMLAKYPDAANHTWRSYLCPVCRGYHISKHKPNEPQIQKKRWMLGFDVKDCT